MADEPPLLSGDPWELAYHANASGLAAPASQLENAKEELRDGQLSQIRDSIDSLSATIGEIQSRVEEVPSDLW